MAADVVSMERENRPAGGGPRRPVYQMSLKTHNILDYTLGIVLLLSPIVFGFTDVSSARATFQNLGFVLIAYSLLTRYRYSVFKLIPLGFHMALDVLLGASLILAPWALGYRPMINNGQLFVHFLLGLGTLMMVGVTRSRTASTIAREDREEIKKAA
jgi:hypothetical protein